jgi:hypothetical protein
MPIDGLPDPKKHRICRRCQKWHEPSEGRLFGPEVSGPLGALQALRATIAPDDSLLRFQCDGCTRIRRTTQLVLYGGLALLVVLVLLLERLGVLK